MTFRIAPLETDGDAHSQMAGMIFGYWACRTVFAVADLSIADHMANVSLTAAEVAAREGSAPETTHRVMRAAVSLGLLTEETGGRFASTPLLGTLRSDDPRTLRPLVLCLLGNWLPWHEFVSGIRTGDTPSANAFGGSMFDYLAAHPDEAELFTAAMAGGTAQWGPAIVDAVDTTGVQCAVDIGGANGSLLRMLQRKDPVLQGIIYDRPNVVEHARAVIARDGLTERTRVLGGDFFEAVPPGDLLLLKFILHDWNDDQASTILRNCRKALIPGGRIAVIEMVVGAENPLAAIFDMNMFIMSAGRERSIEEFDALFAAAGLKRIAMHRTASPQVVIGLGPAEAD